jgi:hypothetical protein
VLRRATVPSVQKHADPSAEASPEPLLLRYAADAARVLGTRAQRPADRRWQQPDWCPTTRTRPPSGGLARQEPRRQTRGLGFRVVDGRPDAGLRSRLKMSSANSLSADE